MSDRSADSMEQEKMTVAIVQRFNDAFNSQDLEAVMALMSEDCVFENTGPAPDGMHYSGKEAVRAAFDAFFRASPQAHFVVEEMFATGERCVVRWVYYWSGDGHVRGVDLFRIHDNRISEKLSYVKG